MRKLSDLYEYLEKNNITLVYTDKITSVYAIYLKIDDEDFILIKKGLTEDEEFFTLTEEIAHYKMGVMPNNAFSKNYNDKLIRSKNEYKAFKYCVNELLPVETLKTILTGNMLKYEIANELHLPEKFVGKALDLYFNNLNNIQELPFKGGDAI